MDEKKLSNLFELLKLTCEEEIDCDEFWEHAAVLAETDVSMDLPELRTYLHHLQLCPGCAEEFIALKEIASENK